jgi:hypothetical protein
MRTYDDGGDAGMGIADFTCGIILDSQSADSSTIWVINWRIRFGLSITAFGSNFFYLIACNSFVETLKLEEKTIFRSL